MKFCQPHWDDLRVAIRDRGLEQLVARSGAAAAKRLASEVQGRATDATYDPLMAAHNLILGNGLRVFGAGLMFGDRCPLCTQQEHLDGCADCRAKGGETPSDWIKYVSDGVLAYALAHKLIGKPS